MQTMRNIFRTLITLTIPCLLWSCRAGDDLPAGSYSSPPPSRNSLDNWILENFTKPYNIEVVYKWTESLVDESRYLHPPLLDSVQPALNIVKKLWIEPYSSVADPWLVRKVAPRQIVLVGGRNRNPTGTVTLGMAEAGKRISLFEVNLLVKNKRAQVTEFIHTVQHEYVHILNQTKPFDEQSYAKITPGEYTAQWYNEKELKSQALGFITAYSRADVREDFAELASAMLVRSREEWNKLLKGIPEPGKSKIKQKAEILVDYYKSEYGIDFYQLQEKVSGELTKML